MLINGTLFTVCSIILPIGLWVGLSIFIKKRFNKYYGVFFGLILSGLAFGFLQAGIPKIYVINENFNVKTYRLFGELNYILVNGSKITAAPAPEDVLIVNNSTKNLVLQELIYGDPDFYANKPEYKKLVAQIDSNYKKDEADSWLIHSYSSQPVRLAYKKIDFFFDEEIPQKIKEYGNRNKSKYWLRELVNE